MEMIRAEIVTIGDELLYGQTLDTNAHWMSAELDKAGIKVCRRTTIGDIEAEILQAFQEAEVRAHIVLITGGLGPTSDDLTKPCLARYFNCDLRIHAEALEDVTAFFKQRGRELTEINRQQAALPVCCQKITNAVGTAPGMWFERNGKVFMSMPGVPHEMRKMMQQEVIPRLLKKFEVPVIQHQIIRTAGIGESFLAEKIAAWENSLPPHIKLAYLPGEGGVKLRLTAMGTDRNALLAEIKQLVASLKPLAGNYIFGYGDDPLEVVVGKMLLAQQLTLATAESCTGGHVAHLITSVPGSSAYFQGGMVAYANDIKIKQLGVKEDTLKTYGAVSEQTVIEMAERVREKFQASMGIATSGVAGPSGGTPEKPVGTVWIACSNGTHTVTKKLQLSKERAVNIQLTTTFVLDMLYKKIGAPIVDQ